MYGRDFTGRSQRGGMGFGFRGTSPPWPYVGRGRGGQPRCAYYLAQGVTPAAASGAAPQGEIDILKEQARAMQEQLERIEARIAELSNTENKN